MTICDGCKCSHSKTRSFGLVLMESQSRECKSIAEGLDLCEACEQNLLNEMGRTLGNWTSRFRCEVVEKASHR